MNLSSVLTLGGYFGKAYDYITGAKEEEPKLERIYVAALFALYPVVEPETRLSFEGSKAYFQRPMMVHSILSGEKVGNLQGVNRALKRKGRKEVGTLVDAVELFKDEQMLEDPNNKYISIFLMEGMRSYMELYPQRNNARVCLKLLADHIDAVVLRQLQTGNARWEALDVMKEYLQVNENKDPSHRTLQFLRAVAEERPPIQEEVQKEAVAPDWEPSYIYKELSYILSKKEGWIQRREAFICFIENSQSKDAEEK